MIEARKHLGSALDSLNTLGRGIWGGGLISHTCITELLSLVVSFIVKIFFSNVGRKIECNQKEFATISFQLLCLALVSPETF